MNATGLRQRLERLSHALEASLTPEERALQKTETQGWDALTELELEAIAGEVTPEQKAWFEARNQCEVEKIAAGVWPKGLDHPPWSYERKWRPWPREEQ